MQPQQPLACLLTHRPPTKVEIGAWGWSPDAFRDIQGLATRALGLRRKLWLCFHLSLSSLGINCRGFRGTRNVEQAPPVHFRCSWGPVQGQMLLGTCSKRWGRPQPGLNTWLGCHQRVERTQWGQAPEPIPLAFRTPSLTSPAFLSFSGQTSSGAGGEDVT